MTIAPYSVLMAAGVVVSLAFWRRLVRRNDDLLVVYISALLGAFVGAKIVYLLAEGWTHFGAPDMYLQLATGKSIVGALLGGYAAVEIAKHWVGYTKPTGDWFAEIVPLAIIIGRVGCLLHGCCLGQRCDRAWYTLDDAEGIARWPAVPMEIVFNVVALVTLHVLRRRGVLPNQHFHLYLIGYGTFRFAHEFVRETPRIFGAVSGYQVASAAVIALGVWRFVARQREQTRDYLPSISSICTQRFE